MKFDFITVSPHPSGKRKMSQEDLRAYNIIINVSDHIDFALNTWLCKNQIQSYWFPLGEAYGMALENVFGALWVLWQADKNKQNVLLHCVVGRNRSRMIKDCYIFMITGEYSEKSSLALNINDNQMPGIYRTEVFLQRCLEFFENPEVAEGAHIDWIKKETFGY